MTILIDVGDRVIPLLNRIFSHLQKLEGNLMGWQDAIAKIAADFDAAVTRHNDKLDKLNAQVTDLQTQVATLQQQLNSANIPADAQATLDALDAKINALDVPAPITPPDQPPATPPTPPMQA